MRSLPAAQWKTAGQGARGGEDGEQVGDAPASAPSIISTYALEQEVGHRLVRARPGPAPGSQITSISDTWW